MRHRLNKQCHPAFDHITSVNDLNIAIRQIQTCILNHLVLVKLPEYKQRYLMIRYQLLINRLLT